MRGLITKLGTVRFQDLGFSVGFCEAGPHCASTPLLRRFIRKPKESTHVGPSYPDPREGLESRSPSLGPYATKGTL